MVFLSVLRCVFLISLALKRVGACLSFTVLTEKHVAIGGTYITHRIDGIFVYLPVHEWLILMVNVGKYTSPMNPMGYTHHDGKIFFFPPCNPCPKIPKGLF